MDSPPDGDFACPVCGKTYMTQGWLDRHVMKEHGGITFCKNCETIVPVSLYCINCGKKLE